MDERALAKQLIAELDEAFERGVRAFAEGIVRDANPYPNWDKGHAAWLEGWKDAAADIGHEM